MTQAADLNILYLTHDLADPATRKRVVMLKDGGAALEIAGFRRSDEPITEIEGCSAQDLGQTFNAGFIQRLGSVLREILLLRRRRKIFAGRDLVIARNLEMLAIAVRARSFFAKSPPIIYESLDIHRLLLDPGPARFLLRSIEGWLSRRCIALLTSSSAFARFYFKPLSKVRLPILLLENKVYDPDDKIAAQRPFAQRCAGPPWKIGWFGAIRCRKSLQLLTDLVRSGEGKIQVELRGRPALDQFDDFYGSVQGIPGLSYLGPYKNPEDLQSIYRGVHFTWAIDMFEEGRNSSWLLPNRLYEGGAFASVPIADRAVETGRFLERHGIGVRISESREKSLKDFFAALTPEHYRQLERACADIPLDSWVMGKGECGAFLKALADLKSASGTSR